MSIDQDIANSARQLATDVKINHDIINGDENTEVATEGGPVPSIRKRLKDIESEWAQTADPLADDLASTVQVVKGYKNDAANSATLAEETLPKVTAEGDKQVVRVTNVGGQQVNQVQSIGQQQEALVNTAGTTQINKVEDAGKTAEQAAHQAQAIADKFGDVDDAVTVATEQADRSETEADRAEKAATGVVTETEEQIKEIQAVGAEQVNAINSKSAEQVAIVTATGAEQSEMVVAAGAEQSQTLEVTGSQEKLEINQLADGRIDDINAAGADLESLVDRAETANTQANTAATEAKKAEANATAIVHNDEGSLTPKPGAYGVADSNGYLDIGWTPLLAAMYPYSGVLGSVDKNDMFTFQQNTTAVDRFYIKGKRAFNIFGRFVNILQDRRIQLPEAESTAERAIAFDDVFLDWNGNVKTYRSITPYRTTASFNGDEIAKEHGYSKIQTRLYKTGETYALLLGRITRLNKGAYHPVFNSEGAAGFAHKDTLSDSSLWARPYLKKKATNTVDCFINATDNNSGGSRSTKLNDGSIKTGGNNTDLMHDRRPDKKFYDAIYADDFTPLYYSAMNVVDRQALLFDSVNRAISGETFSAAEVSSSLVYECTSVQETGYPIFTNSNGFYSSKHFTESCLKVVNLRTGTSWENMDFYFISTGTTTYIRHNLSDDIHSGDQVYIKLTSEAQKGITNNPSARPQFLMVDIIGSLDAMPDEWKTNGLPGNWLIVGEEGESLIPDEARKYFKASRKCLKCYQVLRTTDKGNSWTDIGRWADNESDHGFIEDSLESSINGFYRAENAESCIIIFYQTSANPLELADNTYAAALGINSVLGTYNNSETGMLTNWLINKTPVGFRYNIVNLKSHSMFNTRLHHGGDTRVPVNDDFPILEQSQLSPTCKMLPYLSIDGYLHFVYKEIKMDKTWGDDNIFNIVNNQTTVTDLNGNMVIVGQKRIELPYQFSGEPL